MTKLEELNAELLAHENHKQSILQQIDAEKQIESIKQLEPYQYLVGKCFRDKHDETFFYKILEIIRLRYSDSPVVKVLHIGSDDVYNLELRHCESDVIEINSTAFDMNTMVAINNLIMNADLNLRQIVPLSHNVLANFEMPQPSSSEPRLVHVGSIFEPFGSHIRITLEPKIDAIDARC